jgi:hypothetical protein
MHIRIFNFTHILHVSSPISTAFHTIIAISGDPMLQAWSMNYYKYFIELNYAANINRIWYEIHINVLFGVHQYDIGRINFKLL